MSNADALDHDPSGDWRANANPIAKLAALVPTPWANLSGHTAVLAIMQKSRHQMILAFWRRIDNYAMIESRLLKWQRSGE